MRLLSNALSTLLNESKVRSRYVLCATSRSSEGCSHVFSCQIFFLAGVGQPASDLLKSPFVEKLDARGYQVLLLNEPLDEIVLQNLRAFDSLSFQDVSKKGFKFGDEELDEEADKKMHAEMKEDFAPLSDWIKKAFGNVISDGRLRLIVKILSVLEAEPGRLSLPSQSSSRSGWSRLLPPSSLRITA